MKLQIVASTDGQFIGRVIESDDRPIALRNDVFFDVVTHTVNGPIHRLSSSNYVIDAIEV